MAPTAPTARVVPERDRHPRQQLTPAASRPSGPTLRSPMRPVDLAKSDVRSSVTARQDKRVRAANDAVAEQASADPALAQHPEDWQAPPRPPAPTTPGRPSPPASPTSGTPDRCDASSVECGRAPGSQLHRRGLPRLRHRPGPAARPGPRSIIGCTGRGADHRRVPMRRPCSPAIGRVHLRRPWLALTVTAYNLGRAVGQLAGPDSDGPPRGGCAARSSACPALSHTGRRRHPRLPACWSLVQPTTTSLGGIDTILLR